MRHRSRSAATLGLATLMVAGSGTAIAQSPAAPSSPLPITTVPIQLDFVIAAASGPILWGMEKGYFQDAGIAVDLIPGEGSDLALVQIDSGNVDFAFIDGSNYVRARAEDVSDTTAIYALNNISTTAIASKTPIENPEDMIGKSFGTVPQSSGRQKIPLVLQMNGVDPAQVPIELMDFSVLYPTLFEGQIDTAEVGLPGSYEGAYIAARDQGFELFVKPISDWGYKDYSKVLIVSDDVIANDPGLVQRLVGALYKSQIDALANATPDDIYRLVAAVDPQHNEERAKLEWANVQQYIKDPGPMDDETFQFQLDVLASDGTTTTLTPDQLYTNEFIPAS